VGESIGNFLLEWLAGPLGGDIGGIPVFWIGRVGKLLQLASGLVIILEIIGKERVDEFCADLGDWLADFISQPPLPRVLRDAWLYCAYWWKWKTCAAEAKPFWKSKMDGLSFEPLLVLMGFVSLASAVTLAIFVTYEAVPSAQLEYGRLWWLWVPLAFVFISFLFLMGTNIVLSLLAAAIVLLMMFVIYPVGLLFVAVLKGFSLALGQASVARLMLSISLLLFLAGTLMDLLAS